MMYCARHLAGLLWYAKKKHSQTLFINKRWIYHFTQHHVSFNHSRYYYQFAQCEDPHIINKQFSWIQNTIHNYGVIEQDSYNRDEIGFEIQIASIKRVIYSSKARGFHIKLIQQRNRKWMTARTILISFGSIPPPQIIMLYRETKQPSMKLFPWDIILLLARRAGLQVEISLE
jgi:hypothetical protein